MLYHPLQKSLLVDKNYESTARRALAIVKTNFLQRVEQICRDENYISRLKELDMEASDLLKPRTTDNHLSILRRLEKAAGPGA